MALPEEHNAPNVNGNSVDTNTGSDVVSTTKVPNDDISPEDAYVKKASESAGKKSKPEDTAKEAKPNNKANQEKKNEKKSETKTNNKKSCDEGDKEGKQNKGKSSKGNKDEGKKESDALVDPTISKPTEPAPKTVESDKATSPLKPNASPTPQPRKQLQSVPVKSQQESDAKSGGKQLDEKTKQKEIKQATEEKKTEHDKQAEDNTQAEGADSEDSEPGTLEKIGTVASMIGKGWWNSDKDLFNDGLYSEQHPGDKLGLFDFGTNTYKGLGTAAAERPFIGDAHDFEALHKEFNDSLTKYDQSDFADRKEPHKVYGMPICTENAIMTCAMGTVFSKLRIIDPTRKTILGKCPKNRCAVVTDCVPGVNFDGFGPCWNILNPLVLELTIAASLAAGTFVLTPAPCLGTMMPSPWMPLAPNVLVDKKPVLLDKSLSNCWGLGFITFQECGQGLGPETHWFSDDNGKVNLHLVFAMAANVLGSAVGGVGAIAKSIAAAKAAAQAAHAVALGARGAEAAAQAAKLAQFAKIAGVTSKVGSYGSNAAQIFDGILYASEEDYLSAGLNFIPGAAGVVLDTKAAGKSIQAGKRSAELYENFAKTLDPSMQKSMNNFLKNSGDPDFIKKVIKENPDIYGDLSKMPDAELDTLIRGTKPYQNVEYASKKFGEAVDNESKAFIAHNKAKSESFAADIKAGETAKQLVDAEAVAEKSSAAANKAHDTYEAFEKAGKNVDDATDAYKKALDNQKNIQDEIDRLSRLLSIKSSSSKNYIRTPLEQELRKLKNKMPAAKSAVETAKRNKNKAASAYSDLQQSVKKEYGVDTIEDMKKVVEAKDTAAALDTKHVTELEGQFDTDINDLVTKGVETGNTGKALADAKNQTNHWERMKNGLDGVLAPYNQLADSVKPAQEAAAAASSAGDLASNFGTGFAVAGATIKPAAGDYNAATEESVNAYNGKNPYVLTDEEKRLLDELDDVTIEEPNPIK